MRKIGLIVNPIAGMGGRVGLKGTDGIDILESAIKLGAIKQAPMKATRALNKLVPIRDKIILFTASDDMGENQCKSLGLNYEVVYKSKDRTSSLDTVRATKALVDMAVELIIFVGGDGTARDIYSVVETSIPVVGVPAGVKIHSPVYGNSPEKGGELALLYLTKGLPTKEEEVIDLDEDAYRNNQVRTSLHGYLLVPYKKEFLQNKKAPTPLTEEATQKAIALDIIDHMKEDLYYIIGPGTTTRAIMNELKLPNSLLGVDVIKNKKEIKLNCNEKDLLNIVKNHKAKLIITPTGGQGYLFGRGNQQLSPEVLREIGKENIDIVSTDSKIMTLYGKPLLVYTGNEKVDNYLAGYYRIKVGYKMEKMYKVSRG